MPRKITHAVTVLLALAVMLGSGSMTLAAPAASESERVDDWIASRMAAHRIPGAAVAVVRDGETVHLRGYGQADPSGRQATADTPFLIGSASKPFTAHVVRELVDEGRLSLDERVLPHLEHLVDQPPTGFEQVTIRHLLTHTGGLGMPVGLPGTVPIHTGDDALQHRVGDVLNDPLVATPGQHYEYSNAGYALLAGVVEQVTDVPYHETLRARILDPLGMDDTFALDSDPAAARLATGHRQWFGRWRPATLPFDRAGVAYGYLGSSARDLARFLHAHLDGDTSSVPATAAELADEPVVATGWDLPLEAGQGLGWMVDDLAGHRVVSHAGSLGHFTTHLIMVPGADGLGIAVATNASAFIGAGHEGQYDLSLGLASLLLDQEPEPAEWSPLLVVVAPLMVWLMVALVVLLAVRHITRTLPRWRREAGSPLDGRRWVRRVALPALGLLAVGVVVLVAVPLGPTRHFYPDVGWGATVLAHVCLGWAGLRTLLTLALPRGRRPAGPPDGATTGTSPEPAGPAESTALENTPFA